MPHPIKLQIELEIALFSKLEPFNILAACQSIKTKSLYNVPFLLCYFNKHTKNDLQHVYYIILVEIPALLETKD